MKGSVQFENREKIHTKKIHLIIMRINIGGTIL